MGKFSKLGFILATLGSSIGLGHIWRFPYMVGHKWGECVCAFISSANLEFRHCYAFSRNADWEFG
ncbi:hypothetical protein EC534_05810 [Helicobacter pylori]|nr:hypothetical protein EC534_05810 [Helicobacter pylori]